MTSHYWHINFLLEGGTEYLLALRKIIPISLIGLIYISTFASLQKKDSKFCETLLPPNLNLSIRWESFLLEAV